MERRRFLLTSLAVALSTPLAAEAQQPGPQRRIDVARPGGNLTGVTDAAAALTFSLMKQIMPGLSRVAYIWNAHLGENEEIGNAANASALRGWRSVERITLDNSAQAKCIAVDDPEDLNGAFKAIRRLRVDAAWVASDGMLLAQRERIAELAAKQRLPFFGGLREYADVGGIMAYAPKYNNAYRRAAVHVDKILRNAKAADLPIEQPAEFELIINLKTAKALGLTIPPSLLARADQVIE